MRDDAIGGGGQNCQKLRDVIYGRLFTVILSNPHESNNTFNIVKYCEVY